MVFLINGSLFSLMMAIYHRNMQLVCTPDKVVFRL